MDGRGEFSEVGVAGGMMGEGDQDVVFVRSFDHGGVVQPVFP
jgi:hypothetical protein